MFKLKESFKIKTLTHKFMHNDFYSSIICDSKEMKVRKTSKREMVKAHAYNTTIRGSPRVMTQKSGKTF